MKNKPKRTCGECIHQWACQEWNCCDIQSEDAEYCKQYEKAVDLAELIIKLLKGEKHGRNTQ